MDLLISPSLIESYFANIFKSPKTEFDRDVSALLNNPLNRFVISKDYIDLLQKNTSKSDIASIILPFLGEMINNQTLRIQGEGLTKEEDIINSIDNGYQLIEQNMKKSAYLIVSSKDRKTNNSINFTNLSKPNKNWIFFKLCCHHPTPLTVRYYEFNNDKEIEEAVKAVLILQGENSIINIVDRQTNFGHSLFNSFRQKNLVHYYTSDRSINENVDDFKLTFKRLKVFTDKPKNVHERRIFSKDILVEIDDDFQNVSVSRTTWKFELIYCPIVVSKLTAKLSKFKRLIIK